MTLFIRSCSLISGIPALSALLLMLAVVSLASSIGNYQETESLQLHERKAYVKPLQETVQAPITSAGNLIKLRKERSTCANRGQNCSGKNDDCCGSLDCLCNIYGMACFCISIHK